LRSHSFTPKQNIGRVAGAISGSCGRGGLGEFGFGGLSVGQCDKTAISGTATLDGILNLSLLAGFLPSAGDSLIMMTFNSATRQFAVVRGQDMGRGETWEVIYNPTHIMLAAASDVPSPEPGTLALLGAGLALAVAASRRSLARLCWPEGTIRPKHAPVCFQRSPSALPFRSSQPVLNRFLVFWIHGTW
jgi:hypothetical protein